MSDSFPAGFGGRGQDRGRRDVLRLPAAAARGGVVGLRMREECPWAISRATAPPRSWPPRRGSRSRTTSAGRRRWRSAPRPLRRSSDLGRARGRMGRRFSRLRPPTVDSDAAIHDRAGHAHRDPDQFVKRDAGSTPGLPASLHRRRHQAGRKRKPRESTRRQTMGEHDNIDDHRSLYPAVEDGAGAGSYAPVDEHSDLPKICGFLYANDSLVADVFHAPDLQFDRSEWELKYMFATDVQSRSWQCFPSMERPRQHSRMGTCTRNSSFRPVVKDLDRYSYRTRWLCPCHGYCHTPQFVYSRFISEWTDVAQWKKYLSEQVNDYLAQGGIAYVAPRPGDNVVWSGDQKWDMYYLKEDAFLVLVDPNGQVLQVLEVIEKRAKGVGTMALEFIGFTLDVLTILDLAAIGISVSLIAARGARAGLKEIFGLVLRGHTRRG